MVKQSSKERELEFKKKQLLVEGAIFRARIGLAKQSVLQSMNPRTLMQMALHRALEFAGAGGLAPTLTSLGGKLPTLMPIALTAFSYLARKKKLKWVLGIGIVSASVLGLFLRSKHTSHDDTPTIAE